MCLIGIIYNKHTDYKLVIAANRDEFYDRQTAHADFWKEYPYLLAGKDLEQGGTWLGITKKGKFAALTNFRNPNNTLAGAPSRGLLVKNFLINDYSPTEYLEYLEKAGDEYNGFSILLYDLNEFCYFSNKDEKSIEFESGIFSLSNGSINDKWPKMKEIEKNLNVLTDERNISNKLFKILMNDKPFPENQLPNTNIALEWEKVLSSIFVKSQNYGTRCSTVITIDYQNNIHFFEKTHLKRGIWSQTVHHEIEAE